MSTAFRVLMNGGQEVPPNASAAGGLGTVVFDDTAVTASYLVTVRGLDFGPVLGQPAQTAAPGDDVTILHVHNAPPGASGGVVFGQIGPAHDADDFSAAIQPSGRTVFQGLWETTDGGTGIATFAPALGAATLGSTVDLYFNVHTSAFPGGEIRGQWECIATDAGERVQGTKGADYLPGLGGDDDVRGDNGADRLEGGDGDDVVSGGGHNDIIDGDDGKDRLRGDQGGDTLNGGLGKDKFFYRHANESLPSNPDSIEDLSLAEGDHVDLTRVDANPFTAPDDAFVVVGGLHRKPGRDPVHLSRRGTRRDDGRDGPGRRLDRGHHHLRQRRPRRRPGVPAVGSSRERADVSRETPPASGPSAGAPPPPRRGGGLAYLPMQKLEKIRSRTDSGSIRPVMRPSARPARRTSSAASSGPAASASRPRRTWPSASSSAARWRARVAAGNSAPDRAAMTRRRIMSLTKVSWAVPVSDRVAGSAPMLLA